MLSWLVHPVLLCFLARRSLQNDFPPPMRIRAAAALQKTLAFQDVREGVADQIPSAVAPLVELLQLAVSAKEREEFPGEHNGDAGEPRHEPSSQAGPGPENVDGWREPFKQGRKVGSEHYT